MRRAAILAALGLGLAAPALPQGGAAGLEGFRAAALQADAFEIESSRLALERSRNPAIRIEFEWRHHFRACQPCFQLKRMAGIIMRIAFGTPTELQRRCIAMRLAVLRMDTLANR